MKILWHSVKPTIPTGYGTQTALVVRALRDAGHEMAISCTTGTCGATEKWDGIKCFPDSGHVNRYGMDVVAMHAKKWGADLVVSWHDAFVIDEAAAKNIGRWLAWVPVDSEPLMVRNIKPLKSVRWIAAPTHFGVDMLNGAGFSNVHYLPCAHDPSAFFPMAEGQDEAKHQFGELINRDLSDCFLVNVVSANSAGRKNFQAIFDAWSRFNTLYPKSCLYLHTDITGYYASGTDLMELAEVYGIKNDSVIFVSQWEYNTGQLGDNYLNLMYNASDVHLNCCLGEGFGLPIMDAQAAGCSTIVPEFAAARETGLTYKISAGNFYGTVPGAKQFMVDPKAVSDVLGWLYSTRCPGADRLSLAQKTEPWQIENVVEKYWKPMLEKIEKEI